MGRHYDFHDFTTVPALLRRDWLGYVSSTTLDIFHRGVFNISNAIERRERGDFNIFSILGEPGNLEESEINYYC